MQFREFEQRLRKFVVFSIQDIRKTDPLFYRARLNDWQAKGYIKKLRRGYYIFSDKDINEHELFLVANRLYAPSYISFEMALSHYNLIPEGVYTITSATTKKTARFTTVAGQFAYRTIQPKLFFGYQLERWRDQSYTIAEMEKAVLDYLYLHPEIVEKETFHEWRFNSGGFLQAADEKKFRQYAGVFGTRKFLERANALLRLIHAAK